MANKDRGAITVTLSKEVLDRIKKESDKSLRSISNYVEVAFREYFEIKDKGSEKINTYPIHQ